MTLSVDQCVEAIRTHTRGLADAADGHLGRRIEHCPDWTMADLVWHLTEVQWFWNRVATERPSTSPESIESPPRPPDDRLVAGLRAGADVLVDTLRNADQDAPCWTWGLDENVAFITRHQVQEAAVHHWDAVNAAGSGTWQMDPVVAMDAVDEFLTHSVANRRWPAPGGARLDGQLWFCACVGDSAEADSWYVKDGDVPGTLVHRTFHDGEGVPDTEGPAVGGHGSAEEFLLWLYRRIPNPCVDREWIGDGDLLERFRGFTSTD
jgi:uncharacterized protein (TIGR03083 family)